MNTNQQDEMQVYKIHNIYKCKQLSQIWYLWGAEVNEFVPSVL